MKPKLRARIISRSLSQAFVIARGSRTSARSILVELEGGGKCGRGEAVAYARYGQTPKGELAKLTALPEFDLDQNPGTILPACAARNALDCALWDLRAKLSGKPVYELLGIDAPKPVQTAQTLSLGAPDDMAQAALALADDALIKIKLGAKGDLERIRAIRAAKPAARLILDANEGWSQAEYLSLIDEFVALGVEMIEQPFPVENDSALADLPRPIPICADESAHEASGLDRLDGLYDLINIKLDKTGGLSGALELAKAAKSREIPYMVGCMLASSLSMAPAQLLTGGAHFIDLDGPLFIAPDDDEHPAIRYESGIMHPALRELWG